MFGTIRRHQSWLWLVIIGFMIVGLLYWGDPRGQKNRGNSQVPVINGKAVTQKMLNDAAREAQLVYFLNNRKWADQDTERSQQVDFVNEAYIRLFRTGKAEEAGIRISDATLAEAARRFLGENYSMDRFVKEVLEPRLNAEDFERFLRNEAMGQQLAMLVGAAGRLIPPAEAEAIYRREHQARSGDIVFLSLSNYLSKVVITNGALTNWYAMQTYRTPDQVRVSYVEFNVTNFFPEVEKRFADMTNLTSQLRDIYSKRGPATFKDTNGVVLSESNALPIIREQQRYFSARVLAKQKANEFANKLDDMKPARAENLAAVAGSNGLTVQVSMAFDRNNGPTNLDVPPNFTAVAFSLDATNNPISVQPIEAEAGFYIVALKETIPSRPEPFETILGKVTEDYRRNSAIMLMYSAGTNLIAHATNALALGKTFEEAAAQVGLKAETLPPISIATESVTNLEERVSDLRRLKQILFTLEPGKVSTYTPNPPEGGYVVYARGKLPVDEAKLREEMPKFLAELRQQKQNEIFTQWFSRQIDQSNLPLNKRQKRPGQG